MQLFRHSLLALLSALFVLVAPTFAAEDSTTLTLTASSSSSTGLAPSAFLVGAGKTRPPSGSAGIPRHKYNILVRFDGPLVSNVNFGSGPLPDSERILHRVTGANVEGWKAVNPDAKAGDLMFGSESGGFTDRDHQFRVRLGLGTEASCTLRGNLTNTDPDKVQSTVFKFTLGADYLHPCGKQNGVWIMCKDPSATCGRET